MASSMIEKRKEDVCHLETKEPVRLIIMLGCGNMTARSGGFSEVGIVDEFQHDISMEFTLK